MKKLLFVALTLFFATTCFAQTQKGYVKTKGRLDNDGNLIPGTPLSEVIVKVKDRNEVMSNKRGDFTFPMPDNTYYLENVTKNGYVLTDPDVLSKQYTYSTNKLVIALETREEQIEERMENFTRINAAQNEMIRKLRAEVKQLKEENKITEEEYGKRLQEIADIQAESQQLVEEMVDRYSKIDYDQMSEFDRKISAYILNGELKKADSLLNTKGDLNERAENLKKLNEANAKEREEITKRSKKLEKSETLALKERDDLAKDYYHKFEILKMQHKNDSAGYYLEQRALLDTTNRSWLKEVGVFFSDYLSDYKTALYYFFKELEEAKKQFGESSMYVSFAYSEIGTAYNRQRKCDTAIIYFRKAYVIDSIDNIADDVINSCNNLGLAYYYKGDYDNAFVYFNRSIETGSDTITQKAYTYNTLGTMYKDLGDYDKSIECLQKAMDYWKKEYGEEYHLIGTVYNNLGVTYSELDKTELALSCYKKALELWKNAFGEEYYDVALAYNNIGCIYRNLEHYDEALEYLTKALNIWTKILGEWNFAVAYVYKNLGDVYKYLDNDDLALDYYNKSLQIRENICGHYYYLVAQSYYSIGEVYRKHKDYEKEFEYKEVALDIYTTVFDSNHPSVAKVLNDIGVLYYGKGDYEKALDCLTRALIIREEKFGKDSAKAVTTRNNLEKVQQKLKESSKK